MALTNIKQDRSNLYDLKYKSIKDTQHTTLNSFQTHVIVDTLEKY